MSDLGQTNRPVNPSRPKPCNRRRRPISVARWSSFSAFCSRERAILLAVNPDSPRVRPSVARVRFLERPLGEAA
jgi:hypothetical protein